MSQVALNWCLFVVEKFLGVASLRIEILRSFLRKCGSE